MKPVILPGSQIPSSVPGEPGNGLATPPTHTPSCRSLGPEPGSQVTLLGRTEDGVQGPPHYQGVSCPSGVLHPSTRCALRVSTGGAEGTLALGPVRESKEMRWVVSTLLRPFTDLRSQVSRAALWPAARSGP